MSKSIFLQVKSWRKFGPWSHSIAIVVYTIFIQLNLLYYHIIDNINIIYYIIDNINIK